MGTRKINSEIEAKKFLEELTSKYQKFLFDFIKESAKISAKLETEKSIQFTDLESELKNVLNEKDNNKFFNHSTPELLHLSILREKIVSQFKTVQTIRNIKT